MTDTGQNCAIVKLDVGESFYFRPDILQGHPAFNTCYCPPHPCGSPIARAWYGSYFLMRHVEAGSEATSLKVVGPRPRGNFFEISIPDGHEFYVNARAIAGFCSRLTKIQTAIRFSPTFWFLGKHFFSVFRGPGRVLLYSESPIEQSGQSDFPPRRVLAFPVERFFKAAPPAPTWIASRLMNLLSGEVVWQFADQGIAVVESHAPNRPKGIIGFLRRSVEIALAFLLP